MDQCLKQNHRKVGLMGEPSQKTYKREQRRQSAMGCASPSASMSGSAGSELSLGEINLYRRVASYMRPHAWSFVRATFKFVWSPPTESAEPSGPPRGNQVAPPLKPSVKYLHTHSMRAALARTVGCYSVVWSMQPPKVEVTHARTVETRSPSSCDRPRRASPIGLIRLTDLRGRGPKAINAGTAGASGIDHQCVCVCARARAESLHSI